MTSAAIGSKQILANSSLTLDPALTAPPSVRSQCHVLTYDLNCNRTSDTRYGQQVTAQELTNYDESSGSTRHQPVYQIRRG